MYFLNKLCNKTLKFPQQANIFKGELRTAIGDFYMHIYACITICTIFVELHISTCVCDQISMLTLYMCMCTMYLLYKCTYTYVYDGKQ